MHFGCRPTDKMGHGESVAVIVFVTVSQQLHFRKKALRSTGKRIDATSVISLSGLLLRFNLLKGSAKKMISRQGCRFLTNRNG